MRQQKEISQWGQAANYWRLRKIKLLLSHGIEEATVPESPIRLRLPRRPHSSQLYLPESHSLEELNRKDYAHGKVGELFQSRDCFRVDHCQQDIWQQYVLSLHQVNQVILIYFEDNINESITFLSVCSDKFSPGTSFFLPRSGSSAGSRDFWRQDVRLPPNLLEVSLEQTEFCFSSWSEGAVLARASSQATFEYLNF